MGGESELMTRAKSPEVSKLHIPLPFESNSALYQQYIRFDGGVRFELLLEDLDAAAGNIAFQHSDCDYPGVPPMSLVTAACDGVEMLRRFPMDRDLLLRGFPTYVGSSSMEVWLEIVEEAHPERRVLQSFFVMVAREESSGKAGKMNPLLVKTEEERWRFQLGKVNKDVRRQERQRHLSIQAPAIDEMEMVHRILRKQNQDLQETVPMHETEMESVTITQPQNKNTKNKIFGGYLMRQAFELARTTAYNFGGPSSHPFLLAVDDIVFLRPVHIGSMIRFKSKVVYSPGEEEASKAWQVRVDCEITELDTGNTYRTDEFHFTFASHKKQPRFVLPHSYAEVMHFLDGKRRYESCKQKALSCRSTLYEYYGGGSK